MEVIRASQTRLSIIVPVYNGARELRESLTALAAAAPGEEILAVDDASTDTSAAVATALGARVLRLARNSGPAAARNHGAAQA
ncbi:MAG: glycosyltransferase family 2 protein, partial [Candidatus Rokuibacteriota bacterium]